MESLGIFLIIFNLLTLSGLWIYFIINSKRRGLDFPWTFILVIIGRMVIGVNIGFNLGKINIYVYLLFLLLGCFFYHERRHLGDYFINRHNLLRSIGIGLCIGVLFFLVFRIVGYNLLSVPSSEKVNFWHFASNVLKIVLGEELLFRGCLLGYIRKNDIAYLYANSIQSILFTVGHLQRYLNSGDFLTLFLVLIFGFISGTITWKLENIAGAVMMHGVVTGIFGAMMVFL